MRRGSVSRVEEDFLRFIEDLQTSVVRCLWTRSEQMRWTDVVAKVVSE